MLLGLISTPESVERRRFFQQTLIVSHFLGSLGCASITLVLGSSLAHLLDSLRIIENESVWFVLLGWILPVLEWRHAEPSSPDQIAGHRRACGICFVTFGGKLLEVQASDFKGAA